MEIQNATIQHARDLACLINLAGEGMPAYMWQKMAGENSDVLDVGAARAARKTGSFSYSNAKVCVNKKQNVLGMILAYSQPQPYQIDDLSAYPDFIQPLVKLESLAPGSWYVNAIATYPEHQGKGVAKALLMDTEIIAANNHCKTASLIVASENTTARHLYDSLGYRTDSSLPVVDFPGVLHAGSWLLLIKDL